MEINFYFEQPMSFCMCQATCFSLIPGLVALGIAGSSFSDADDCGKNLPLWLLLDAVALVVNMAVAVYCFCKF